MSQDPVFYLLIGSDFDCYAKTITVRGDRIGATVRKVKIGAHEVRVLAHDDEGAEDAARAHLATSGANTDGGQLEILP